ncbi:hypothetical protein LCGC14_0209760 [marine sediment metagenome]|uniref:Uncharacterized protein n=1 Tax=marine sediment metagenome TaxID=412755 RepID=A0A0F9XJ92_9ZZZZ|nr:hypothetical protein [Halomonas sp.]HDZ48220.1 hypothetical protein [Halomonas sp.]
MKARSRPWFIAGSILSALASLYCFLWIFSAASLASGFCGSDFSLFAEHLRCRQVHFAMILTALFGLLCVYLGWRAARAGHGAAA